MIQFHLPDGEEVSFPVLDQVHYIHDNFSIAPNNLQGVSDEAALLGALARPQNVLAYRHPPPDLITLAAYLWHGVSEAHGYQDGNKRTGVLSAISFLAANGVVYDAPEHDIGRFVLRLYKRRKFTVATLEDFLRRYCRWA